MSSELQQHLRGHLEALARQRKTISYRELASLAEIPGPQVMHRLTSLLEEIVREDHMAGIDASVAALAVSRTAPNISRKGYFILLRELGIYSGPDEGEDAEVFHQRCTQQAFQRFSQ